MALQVDALVVGAGFSGAVVAERLAAEHGLRCLVIDRRDHLGGNCHDAVDPHGVRVHSYGPHWFRTDSDRVRDYLGRFTAWRPVSYRVLSFTDGRYWPFPVNLDTFEQLLGRPSSSEEMRATLAAWREPIAHPASSEELVLSQVGRVLYEKFYRGYTRKMWGRDPGELDPSVCGRIPVRFDRDPRYRPERFQALPADGYTRLFERLLDHPLIRVELRTSLADLLAGGGAVRWRHLVYTGSLDELEDGRLGPLPYRTLRFERETLPVERAQPAMQVNYPNDHDYVRVVEPKQATGQGRALPVTTIVREFAEEWTPGRERFYALPTPGARALHGRYATLVARRPDTTVLGRLATYHHLDMDHAVAAALTTADRLGPRLRGAA